MKSAGSAGQPARADLRRFVVFLATGGFAALVNIASRFGFEALLRHNVGLDGDSAYALAVALAYLVGMATAFVLAKLFVFETSGRNLHIQLGRFALVNLAALLQVWIVSLLLAYRLFPMIGFTFHAETVAHVIGVLSPVVVSYYGHKRFSFA